MRWGVRPGKFTRTMVWLGLRPYAAPPCAQARKPYTITKQRERWTEDEHQRFLEALKLHGRAWRKIEGAPPQPAEPALLSTPTCFRLRGLRPPRARARAL